MRDNDSATALALFAMLACVSAVAQSDDDLRPLMDRLDRLERDVNLLQRQLYRGGASSPQGAAPAGSAIDAEVRLGRLEEQMRGLTGQVEDLNYKIQQLSQRLDRLQTDIDFRLQQLEHPGSAPSAAAAPPQPALPPVPPARTSAVSTPPAAPDTSGSAPVRLRPPPTTGATPAPAQPSGSSGVLGTVVVPDTEAGGATPPQTAALPPQNATGSPLEQYNAAFALLRQARYDEAEQALRAFIQRNPKDPLAGNAQYWLGESFFARRDYTNAASAFAEGYEKYPHSPKAPDDLLKLGITLGILGQKDNACRVFARLDRDFPQAQTELRDRATSEKKRLGCAG
jgi:tol-pal system protein YbgF